MKTSRRGYAFFDLDRTLLADDSMLLFCNYTLKKERWRTLYLFILIPAAILFCLRIIGALQFKRSFFSYLYRMKADELQKHAKNFIDNCLMPRFFPELLKEIELQREKGRLLILNTASPAFYVWAIAEKLGFDHFRDTRFVCDKRMPLIPLAESINRKDAKVRAMSDLLPPEIGEQIKKLCQPASRHTKKNSKQSIMKIANSSAYTDSAHDLPMIQLAEEVTLVGCPGYSLRKVAQQNGWRILLPQKWKKKRFSPLLQIAGLYD